MKTPYLDIWVTSTGRKVAIDCVQENLRWLKQGETDFRFLIFESQPDNPHGTVEAFKALDCEKKIWVGDYPPLGWIYNLFLDHSGDFFLRVDDDCWFVCEPSEMIADACALLQAQPLRPRVIGNVPLEMNPRMAYDAVNKKIPEEGNTVPTFEGYADCPDFGPLALVHHPGSLHIARKDLVFPFNETCHWRQTELYYILLLSRARTMSAYMLRWWGCMGHFSPEGVDGVSRQRNLNAYNLYRDKGYFGRRPEDTRSTPYEVESHA